jgi:chromosome segregation ATPase
MPSLLLLLLLMLFSCSNVRSFCCSSSHSQRQWGQTDQQRRQQRSFLPAAATPKPLDTHDDSTIERYKNRATLVQHVLQQKLVDIESLESKLLILQNVTRQLVRERDEFKTQIQFQSAQIQQQQEMLQQVQSDLERANALVATTVAQRDALELQHEQTQRDHRLALELQQEQSQSQIQALQTELFDLDQMLEQTSASLISVRKESQQDKELVVQLEQAKDTQFKSLQQTVAQSDESVQIAVAAVAAAERRESALRYKYKQLQQQQLEANSTFTNEIRTLRGQIVDFEKQIQLLQSLQQPQSRPILHDPTNVIKQKAPKTKSRRANHWWQRIKRVVWRR